MARHSFDLGDPQKVPTPPEDPTEVLITIDGRIRLKQRDAAGDWSPTGTYGQGEMIVETWRPQGLTELLGFWGVLEEDVDKGDLVEFRMSADEGVTPLFWDGGSSVWRVPADATEWNSERETDTGISTFPFAGSITTHIRLTSGDGTSTPIFRGFFVFWEVRYNATEDLIRSIHSKIVSQVAVQADFVEVLDAFDEIDLSGSLWKAAEPIFVYNRTDDPLLANNLFASFVDDVVTLTSPQTGELLVRYRGSLKTAHVSSDADFELQELPAVVISNISQDRVRDFKPQAVEEQLRSKGIVRLRSTPARHSYVFRILCNAQDALHDKILGDAVRHIFDEEEWVRSQALDEDFPLVALESVTQGNRVADQVFTRTVNLTVSVLEWLPNFRDIPMVLTIEQRGRPFCGTPASLADPE